MKQRILRRSRKNRLIAGVCGGIAEYIKFDPIGVRIAYVLLSLLTAFAGCIVYVILWIVIPEREREPFSLKSKRKES